MDVIRGSEEATKTQVRALYREGRGPARWLRSRLGTLGRNTFYVAIGQFVHLVLAIVLTPIAARVLGDSDFGRYSLASTLMYFVFLFSDLGLNTWITREGARDAAELERLFPAAFAVKLCLLPPLLVLLWLATQLTGLEERSAQAVAIFGFYGAASSLWQLALAVFRSRETMKYEPILFALEKTLITGASLAVFFLIKGGLLGFVLTFPAAGLVTLIVSLWILHSRFLRLRLAFRPSQWFGMVKLAFPFGLSALLATVYNRVDVILLTAMTTPAVVGWYSAGYKLLTVTNLIPTVVATATFPRFAALQSSDRRQLSRVFWDGMRLLLTICVPMVILGTTLAKPITLFLFGAEYFQTAPAIQILIWACGIVFFNIYLTGFLGALGYQNRVVGFQVAATVVNVGTNLVLIPHLQHLGAAAATVVTEGLMFTLQFGLALRRLVDWEPLRISVPLVAASLSLGLCIALTTAHRWNVVAVLAVGIAAYVAVFLLSGGRKAFSLLST